MTQACITCGSTFTLLKRNPGLRGECRDCGVDREAELKIKRHVGLQGGGGKHSGATIFKNPSKGLSKLIRQMNSGTFQANNGLGIGSTTSTFGEKD